MALASLATHPAASVAIASRFASIVQAKQTSPSLGIAATKHNARQRGQRNDFGGFCVINQSSAIASTPSVLHHD
jgi:hypothetical protein